MLSRRIEESHANNRDEITLSVYDSDSITKQNAFYKAYSKRKEKQKESNSKAKHGKDAESVEETGSEASSKNVKTSKSERDQKAGENKTDLKERLNNSKHGSKRRSVSSVGVEKDHDDMSSVRMKGGKGKELFSSEESGMKTKTRKRKSNYHLAAQIISDIEEKVSPSLRSSEHVMFDKSDIVTCGSEDVRMESSDAIDLIKNAAQRQRSNLSSDISQKAKNSVKNGSKPVESDHASALGKDSVDNSLKRVNSVTSKKLEVVKEAFSKVRGKQQYHSSSSSSSSSDSDSDSHSKDSKDNVKSLFKPHATTSTEKSVIRAACDPILNTSDKSRAIHSEGDASKKTSEITDDHSTVGKIEMVSPAVTDEPLLKGQPQSIRNVKHDFYSRVKSYASSNNRPAFEITSRVLVPNKTSTPNLPTRNFSVKNENNSGNHIRFDSDSEEITVSKTSATEVGNGTLSTPFEITSKKSNTSFDFNCSKLGDSCKKVSFSDTSHTSKRTSFWDVDDQSLKLNASNDSQTNYSVIYQNSPKLKRFETSGGSEQRRNNRRNRNKNRNRNRNRNRRQNGNSVEERAPGAPLLPNGSGVVVCFQPFYIFKHNTFYRQNSQNEQAKDMFVKMYG